jgi:N-acetylneuraminate synthase
VALNQLSIADTVISKNEPVFLIAEIGINHNGSLDITKRLIDASFGCNWNAVKFQKRSPDICVPDHQKGVLRETPWGTMTYLEYKYKIEFGKNEYDYIDQYCKEKPIIWSASVWDMPSLSFILKYDVPFIKIPSAKMVEFDLLKEACTSGKVIIMSTGMSTLAEVDEAVNTLEKHTKGNYILMHTNSTYPSPPEELNLNTIPFLKERYQCLVGYSGHEYDLEPTVIAAALGACVVERHITIDHQMWGSDHFASLEVHAADMLYKRIKNINKVLGKKEKIMTKGEVEIKKKLRG